jgi:hypothetical protein
MRSLRSTRPSGLTRLALAVAGLLGLAACVVNLQFDVVQDLVVDATGSSISTVVPVDLTQYKEVQDHKGNVQSFSLDSVDVKITAVGAANKATSITGALAVRAQNAPADGSQDVLVGQLNNFAVSPNATFHLPSNPALDLFLFNQIKGAGQFSVVVSGSTAGGEAHLTLNAKLHANLGYGVL